jgi:hypothetical protein
MKKFTHYHHLRVSDNDTLDLLPLDAKFRYKNNNDTYGSLVAKTTKDDGASENYVKSETVEKLKNKGAVIKERNSSWMIVDTANDQVEDGIDRQQLARLKLKPGDHGYAFTVWFTLYNVVWLDVILAMCWVYYIYGTYHINHRINEMWIIQGDIPMGRQKHGCTNPHALWPVA